MTKIYATASATRNLRELCAERDLPLANAMRDFASGARVDDGFEVSRSESGDATIAVSGEAIETDKPETPARKPYRQPLWRFSPSLPGAPSESLLAHVLLEEPYIPLYNPVTETYVGTRQCDDDGIMKFCHGKLSVQDAVEFMFDSTSGDVVGTFSDIEDGRWSCWYGDLRTDYWLPEEVDWMTADLAHLLAESDGGWIFPNIDDGALTGAQQLYRFCLDIGAEDTAAKVQEADGERLDGWLRDETFSIVGDDIPQDAVAEQLMAGRSLWNPSSGSVFAPDGDDVVHMRVPAANAGKLASRGDSPEDVLDLREGGICLMPVDDASALAASEGAGVVWINAGNKFYGPHDQAFDFCCLLVESDPGVARALDSIAVVETAMAVFGKNETERMIDLADTQSIGQEWLLSSEDGPLRGFHSPEAYRAYFDADPDGGLAEQKAAGTTFDSWVAELKRMGLASPCPRPQDRAASPSAFYAHATKIAGTSIGSDAQGEPHVKL